MPPKKKKKTASPRGPPAAARERTYSAGFIVLDDDDRDRGRKASAGGGGAISVVDDRARDRGRKVSARAAVPPPSIRSSSMNRSWSKSLAMGSDTKWKEKCGTKRCCFLWGLFVMLLVGGFICSLAFFLHYNRMRSNIYGLKERGGGLSCDHVPKICNKPEAITDVVDMYAHPYGKCLQFFFDKPRVIESARLLCSRLNGRLLEVRSNGFHSVMRGFFGGYIFRDKFGQRNAAVMDGKDGAEGYWLNGIVPTGNMTRDIYDKKGCANSIADYDDEEEWQECKEEMESEGKTLATWNPSDSCRKYLAMQNAAISRANGRRQMWKWISDGQLVLPDIWSPKNDLEEGQYLRPEPNNAECGMRYYMALTSDVDFMAQDQPDRYTKHVVCEWPTSKKF